MKISEALEELLVDLECENRTQKTLDNYKAFIGYFIKYIGDIDVKDITIKQCKLYIQNLKRIEKQNGKKLSLNTIQTYVRHLRRFLNYLYQEEYTDIDFMRKVKLPKGIQRTKEVLTDNEMLLIFGILNGYLFYERNLAIIALLHDTGIRKQELVNLNLSDLNMDNRYIKVLGKGNKERLVNFGIRTKKCLSVYLKKRKYNKDNALFVDKFQNRIGDGSLRRLQRNIKHDTGIERFNWHLLRHTFGTRWILEGKNAFALQVMLGHSDISVTQAYVHIAGHYQVMGIELHSVDIILQQVQMRTDVLSKAILKNLRNNINDNNEIKGIAYDKKRNKWRAYITYRRHFYHIGYYDNMDDAIQAREQKQNKILQEFANA